MFKEEINLDLNFYKLRKSLQSLNKEKTKNKET